MSGNQNAPHFPNRILYAVQLMLAGGIYYLVFRSGEFTVPDGVSVAPLPAAIIVYGLYYIPILLGWLFLISAIFGRLKALRWPLGLGLLSFVPGVNIVLAIILLFKLPQREEKPFDKKVWVDVAKGDLSGVMTHYTSITDYLTKPKPDTYDRKGNVQPNNWKELQPGQVAYLLCLAIGAVLKVLGQHVRFEEEANLLYYLGYGIEYLGIFVILAGLYRRLLDIRWTPFLTLLYFFPGANAVMILLLMFNIPKGPEKPFDKNIWSDLAQGNASSLMNYLLEKEPKDKRASVFPDPDRYAAADELENSKEIDTSGKDEPAPEPPAPPPVKKPVFTGTPTVQRSRRWW